MINNKKDMTSNFFGNTPIMKIISFLLENDIWDYSLTDICKGANVSWGTLHKLFPSLVRHGLVKETRRVGRAKLYRLNEKNPIVRALAKIQLALAFPEYPKVKVTA